MKILCPLWIKFSVIAILWFHLWFTVTNWSLVWFLHPIENYRSSSPFGTCPGGVTAELLAKWARGNFSCVGNWKTEMISQRIVLCYSTVSHLWCHFGPPWGFLWQVVLSGGGGPWGQEWITHWMYFVVSLWLTCSPSGSTMWLLPLGPPTGGSLRKEVAPGDRGELLF